MRWVGGGGVARRGSQRIDGSFTWSFLRGRLFEKIHSDTDQGFL